jgi:hypothetical protein
MSAFPPYLPQRRLLHRSDAFFTRFSAILQRIAGVADVGASSFMIYHRLRPDGGADRFGGG